AVHNFPRNFDSASSFVQAGYNAFSSSSEDALSQSFINAPNAPHWDELTRGPGLVISGGTNQPRRRATSWANEVFQAAGINRQANSYAPGHPLIMAGATVQAGGPNPYHATHQAGMDLDIDTPSTNDLFDKEGNWVGQPFFDVVQDPNTGVRYVAA